MSTGLPCCRLHVLCNSDETKDGVQATLLLVCLVDYVFCVILMRQRMGFKLHVYWFALL